MSKQHSALTKPERSQAEYNLGEIAEKFSSLNQTKVQILTFKL